jgi:DNA-binding beta-propeller fold protein YncE
VADTANNRLLEFNTPLKSGVTAAKVFGQDSDFTSSSCDFDTDNSVAPAVDMCDPSGVVVDWSSNLYVADSDNSRVLEFNDPLGASTARPTRSLATAGASRRRSAISMTPVPRVHVVLSTCAILPA